MIDSQNTIYQAPHRDSQGMVQVQGGKAGMELRSLLL
jgi:hypothetical protein